MRVRRFSADRGSKVPGGHPGLFAVPVLWDQALARGQDWDDLARRLNGAPLLVDAPVAVAALYFDPNARMDEHDADHPILLLVTSGQGFVRLGGAAGETRAIGAGARCCGRRASSIRCGLKTSHWRASRSNAHGAWGGRLIQIALCRRG